jgi:type VI secretion system VasD/TssJ family lipoprotein
MFEIVKMALVAAILINCSSCSTQKSTVESAESQLDKDLPGPAARSEISRAQAMKASQQTFKKEAIKLLIKADSQLNRFEKNSHTLFLCLYQLKDPNGFNQLAQEKDGLPKLVECSRFDATVANAKQFVVQPGQELSEVCDKAEGTRYIGVATGYYGMGKEKVTELSPLLGDKGGGGAGSLVRIDLGAYRITSIEVK